MTHDEMFSSTRSFELTPQKKQIAKMFYFAFGSLLFNSSTIDVYITDDKTTAFSKRSLLSRRMFSTKLRTRCRRSPVKEKLAFPRDVVSCWTQKMENKILTQNLCVLVYSQHAF